MPVDWDDPGQASLQAKIDVLRNLVRDNPMTYSEKDELVKQHLTDEARRAAAERTPAVQEKRKNWGI
ncbi:MAG: hypothetical protein GX417_12370 [Clostridiales bacterium]|nr:hypothetical protein [Clostridiales bacterium]